MEDIFFSESSEAPVPPDEVQIRTLTAKARADKRRINVHFEITPFQQRPNIEIRIQNEEGQESAKLSVVESIDSSMDFTMHLRDPETAGAYTLTMVVSYSDLEAHEKSSEDEISSGEILDKAIRVIDQKAVHFKI